MILSNTRLVSDFDSIRATASTGSPLTLPKMPHFWMVTRGVMLMRLVFHEPSSVMTNGLSPSGTPQTVVGFGRPSLVKGGQQQVPLAADVLERGHQSASPSALSSMVTFFDMPPRSFENRLNVLPRSPYRLPIAP